MAVSRPGGRFPKSGSTRRGNCHSASRPSSSRKGPRRVLGGDCASSRMKFCELITTWSSIGQRDELIAYGNTKRRFAPLGRRPRRRTKNEGIFAGGDRTGSLSKYCEQIENCPSIVYGVDFINLKYKANLWPFGQDASAVSQREGFLGRGSHWLLNEIVRADSK